MSEVKLYELTDSYLRLMELAEDTDQQVFADTLQSIQEVIEDKAENIAKLVKNLSADIDALKSEEKRLADRRKVLENKVDWLKQYLKEQMEVAGIDKVKRPTLNVSIQNNPPKIKVINEGIIPSQYMIQQDPKLDKKAMLADLKNGVDIPGVELEKTKGVRIR
jgi:DNA mismatch repair ATPase MutS